MYRRSFKDWQKHLDFILIDLLCVQIAFIVAQFIRFHQIMYASEQSRVCIEIAITLGLFSLVAGVGLSGYKNVLRRGYLVEAGYVMEHTILVVAMTVIYGYLVGSVNEYSRGLFIWTSILFYVFAYAARCGRKTVLRRHKPRSMVLVCLKGTEEETFADFENNRAEGIAIKAVMTLDCPLQREKAYQEQARSAGGRRGVRAGAASVGSWDTPSGTSGGAGVATLDGAPSSGYGADAETIVSTALYGKSVLVSIDRDALEWFVDFKSLTSYIMKNWVDEVYLDFADYGVTDENGVSVQEFLTDCKDMGVIVHVRVPHIPGTKRTSQVLEKVGGHIVLTASSKVVSPAGLLAKRLMDIVGGAVGCFLTGILTLFFAPAIYISSPGPIFFTQDRVGRNGKIFKVYKFRSMYPDAEERKAALMEKNKMQGLMFKMDNDPRIIGSGPDGTKRGIGHFLRNTSLDEFPQFWNVLKGDMSLVGTRPPTVDEYKHYDLHHRARVSIKPGITGMWQVSGRSEITDFEKVVELDMKYIEDWSLALDIKILFLTVIAVLRRKGAE